MTRFVLKGIAFMSVAVLSLMSGCGGGSSSVGAAPAQQSSAPTPAQPKPVPPSAIPFPKGDATSTISGTVTLNGKTPEMKPIDMSSAALCATLHKTKVLKEEIVAQSGNLANAVVYIKSVNGKPVESVWTFDPPTMTASIDQKECMYVPHVIAVQASQTTNVNILSSDDMAHNVHYTGANREFSESFQKPGSTKTATFTEPELGGVFACNVHFWMKAYINVFPHPFFAITDSNGAYTLPKLPPGDYEVAVWHESANDNGKLEPADPVKVTLGANATFTQNFALKVK